MVNRFLLALFLLMPNFVQAEQFKIQQAIRVALSSYGDLISVTAKSKNLFKFGRNEAVGTSPATIMTLPTGITDETFVSTNLITHAASASTADTMATKIEGHTCSGGIPTTFVVQDFTFEGRTKKALTTPLCRVTRLYNDSSTDMTGPLYVAQDVTFTNGVPQTASAIHLTVPAGENQSFKASTSLSATDYWIVTEYNCNVLEKGSSQADIRLEVRLPGKVFRPVSGTLTCSNTSPSTRVFQPYLVIPASSDIRLRATASGSNIDVSGGIEGYLAVIE